MKKYYALFSDEANEAYINGDAVSNNGLRSTKGYYWPDQPEFEPCNEFKEMLKQQIQMSALNTVDYLIYEIALPGTKRFVNEVIYPAIKKRWNDYKKNKEQKKANTKQIVSENCMTEEKKNTSSEVTTENKDETAEKIVSLSNYRNKVG